MTDSFYYRRESVSIKPW